jgi:hypothetical protein
MQPVYPCRQRLQTSPSLSHQYTLDGLSIEVASLHRHRYRDGGLLPRCIANRTRVQACFSTAANQAPCSTTSSPTLRRNRRTGVNYGIVCYYGPVFTNLDLCRHVSSNASLRLTKRAQQRSGEVCLASAHTKPPRVTLGWYCLPPFSFSNLRLSSLRLIRSSFITFFPIYPSPELDSAFHITYLNNSIEQPSTTQ